ncbi:hypothetical protein D3C81_1729590 [compost metagenome]
MIVPPLMVTSRSNKRNTVNAALKSLPYINGITKGAKSIRNTPPSMVKVVLIRKALNVNSTACSLDSSEALGNNTIVIELEKKLTIRDRLTATTYSPKSAGLNKPAITI